jgi:GntR family transcriptional regulator
MTKTAFQFRLDAASGVPVYRQIMDQITGALSSGALSPGTQLPTVRQLSVDLAINPNTVLRAYRELEIRGVLDTQQGTGTFVAEKPATVDGSERSRRLAQLLGDVAARAGEGGFSLEEVIEGLRERLPEKDDKRRK